MKRTLLILSLITSLLQPTLAEGKFLNVFQKDGKYIMEIPQSTLGRDILVSTTIMQGAARKNRTAEQRFGYGGDAVFSKLIQLKKDGDQIQITMPFSYLPAVKGSIYDNYNQSLLQPIAQTFDIIESKDSSYQVDITQFLKSDDQLISLHGATEEIGLGGYDPQQSYISSIKCYQENVNFCTFRTYMDKDPRGGKTSWLVGTSWMLLPKEPMRPRISDSRVGYFKSGFKTSLLNHNSMDDTEIINHWRLEPKTEDEEKYLRGELVEPKKPIIYYIDANVPDALKPYFIKGVEKWNEAFEKAGFKNAIKAKIQPTQEEDSTYSEEDLRYSLISFKASPIANAYGPMTVDPRSGEILNSHVAIFYSVMQLLQRWYFVQTAAANPIARQYPLPVEEMGKLIQEVVTHEVGHTLGLRHCFTGSTIFPSDSLRNADFVRKNGIGTSVMDYQRFNYVAQPGDGLNAIDFLPKIGTYDKYAIEYGYRWNKEDIDFASEAKMLSKWVDDKRNENPNLVYIEEGDFYDPRVLSEDCGKDLVNCNLLSVKNLKRDMDNLMKWNPGKDSGYYTLRKRYLSVLQHYDNLTSHLVKLIGGYYHNEPSRSEKLAYFQPVTREEQKKAMEALNELIFKEPKWLFPKWLAEKTGVTEEQYGANIYKATMSKIIFKNSNLDKNMSFSKDGYTTTEMMNDLAKYMFFDKPADNLTAYDRTLQNELVTQLTICAENPTYYASGFSQLCKELLEKIKAYAEEGQTDHIHYVNKAHLKTMVNFVTVWQNGKPDVLLNAQK